jgi:ferredoxin
MTVLAHAVGLLILLWSAAFAGVSLRERERRAAAVALAAGVAAAIPYVGVRFLWLPWREPLATALVILASIGALAVLLPSRRRPPTLDDTPRGRIDERDTMFARRDLAADPERYRDYYSRRPENKETDDGFRRRPGLLAEGATYYHPELFAAAAASFSSVRALRTLVDRCGSGRAPTEVDPASVTRFVRGWGRKLGAVSVGFTELRDYHLYSHVGRGAEYGDPVVLNHSYAIVVTVEMDRDMVGCAPQAPTVMESAQQYLASGAVAVQIAELIRELGHSARAHIDGNYRVLAPLVARDAGLGEIGRMGLLMTPQLGPRVRVAVVTTDLPLVPDPRSPDPSVIHFCGLCKKCASNCPAGAIPFGDRTEIQGVRRWQINQEACFTYWCGAGTDCARCIRVCPYSHPGTLLHNAVRAGIRNSRLFARLALRGDDLLYGKRPPVIAPPPWMTAESREGGRAT